MEDGMNCNTTRQMKRRAGVMSGERRSSGRHGKGFNIHTCMLLFSIIEKLTF